MKTFADLQPDECRWPTDNTKGRFFCAEPIAQKSYCAHHYARAYPAQSQRGYALPPERRKRVAETKSGEIHNAPEERAEPEAVDCFDAMGGANG